MIKTDTEILYDANNPNSWFVKGEYKEKGNSHTPFNVNDCTINPTTNIIEVSRLNYTEGEITINTIRKGNSGVTAIGSNVIFISTQRNPLERKKVLRHEIGHKTGLASTSSDSGYHQGDKYHVGRGLNAGEYYYDQILFYNASPDTDKRNTAHIGPHCFAGEESIEKFIEKETGGKFIAKCVMYGHVNSPSNLCESCKRDAKRIDLSIGCY